MQREDYSDIEKKVVNYNRIMQDLDKTEMFKAIRAKRQQEFMRQHKK